MSLTCVPSLQSTAKILILICYEVEESLPPWNESGILDADGHEQSSEDGEDGEDGEGIGLNTVFREPLFRSFAYTLSPLSLG